MARNESTSVSASGFPGAAFASAWSRVPEREKLTMRAPPLFSTSRREVCRFMVPSSRTGRAHDRLDNAGVRPAPAQVLRKGLLHLRLGGLFVDGKKGGRFHNHAVDAVTALRGLLLDESALDRVRLLWRAEAFERDDLLLRSQG